MFEREKNKDTEKTEEKKIQHLPLASCEHPVYLDSSVSDFDKNTKLPILETLAFVVIYKS